MIDNYYVTAISALGDNYIWTLYSSYCALVIDPGDSLPVIDFLEKKKLHLAAILLTHHHFDHVGGVPELVERYSAPVYCPADSRFPGSYERVGDSLRIHYDGGMDIFLRVMFLPGHTRSHVAYYSSPFLFCGDVLFSGGCGRVFEGTHQQMFSSLDCLAKLPDETMVFCAHEYTQNNLRFAKVVEPNNHHLIYRIKEVDSLLKSGQPSVPSRILDEKLTNPFLRCNLNSVREFCQRISSNDCATPLEVFSTLRAYKDQF
ncbi:MULTISPECIES: hydroxyacylglutathione hydrolase [Candidatus Ichthyocystis]|uniref:Hydroxyacylglutathione hydrolase n=1 Tax=Candidatus Ichthyocystis hellenicum TaxID=1561003 RepID=A0A0S4M1H9_9BURK|nr:MULTISPECIES: hydroxyacylglutathione hydrolase [Ichthyocystis]CUT17625.1 Hydroxyacylglutathione hydrolase [Candidatus Ichthyocystis hellenicum]